MTKDLHQAAEHDTDRGNVDEGDGCLRVTLECFSKALSTIDSFRSGRSSTGERPGSRHYRGDSQSPIYTLTYTKL